MNEEQKQIAEKCMKAAEDNSMDFPDIVKQLSHAGFERYIVDFSKANVTYYLPSGENIVFETTKEDATIVDHFNRDIIENAIKKAQQKADNYTYRSFCKKIMSAGCIGYIVSFLGKRAVYFGRAGEVHIEYFPGSNKM